LGPRVGFSLLRKEDDIVGHLEVVSGEDRDARFVSGRALEALGWMRADIYGDLVSDMCQWARRL
jgi:hypothetical protein